MEKYKFIRDKDLASAIVFLTNESYMIFDDKNDTHKKIYSFILTDNVQLAIDKLIELKNKLK